METASELVGDPRFVSARSERRVEHRWPQQLARYTPHVVVQILSSLGVPYATFDETGDCSELSSSARAVLGAAVHRACRLSGHLVRELVRRHRDGASVGNPGASAADPDGALELHVRLLPPGDKARVGVALLFPMRMNAEGADGSIGGLTRREAEIARLIASGATTRMAAASLGISIHTVRRHTERVLAKLGVRSRAQVAPMLNARQSAARALER